jgi:hypothetical protein
MHTETDIISSSAALLTAGDETLHQIRAALRAEHAPQGPSENYFIEQMAAAIFRSTRFNRAGTGVFHSGVKSYLDLHPDQQFESSTLTSEEMAGLGDALLGIAFRADVQDEHGTISLLARLTDGEYRNFDRALRQLQSLQEKRASRAAA